MFYKIFEENKSMKDRTFRSIVESIYESTKECEASFSSKILHTLDPSYPIFDSIVLGHLGIKKTFIKNTEKRINQCVEIYTHMINEYSDFLKTITAKNVIQIFQNQV
jgi:hypothetical protein